jgi:ribosomal protein S13
MLREYFLLDKVLHFIKRVNNLESLNLYQLYLQRYGISKKISNKISVFSGVHSMVKMIKYEENDINIQIKFIFYLSESNLDIGLEKKMLYSLQNSIDIYDYRGSMYKAKLPVNGQRRRANSKTVKRNRPIQL